jgi:hypothetical protein
MGEGMNSLDRPASWFRRLESEWFVHGRDDRESQHRRREAMRKYWRDRRAKKKAAKSIQREAA